MKIVDEIIISLTTTEESTKPDKDGHSTTTYHYKGKLKNKESFELSIPVRCSFLEEGNVLLGIGVMENNHWVLTAVLNTESGKVYSTNGMSVLVILSLLYISSLFFFFVFFIFLSKLESPLPEFFIALFVGILILLFIFGVQRFLQRRKTNKILRNYWAAGAKKDNQVVDDIITTLTESSTQKAGHTAYHYQGELKNGGSFKFITRQNFDLKNGDRLLGIGVSRNNHCILASVIDPETGRTYSVDYPSIWDILISMGITIIAFALIFLGLFSRSDSPVPEVIIALFVGYLIFTSISSRLVFLKRRKNDETLRTYWLRHSSKSNN